MATKGKAGFWAPPDLPKAAVPAEAFLVGDASTVGQIDFGKGPIEINNGREVKELVFINTGDRPIQIGAHYHLFEANRAMAFDREAAFGFRLDIPSGSAIRFEPGQSRKCQVVRFAGAELSMGLNDLTNGSMRSDIVRRQAVLRAREQGYCFEGERVDTRPRADERKPGSPPSARKAQKEHAT